ncbi:nicotinate-nucleotide--dimethylbenzimidazole phosphoribosyltransferase [Conexibacter sp. SYSU D00693]|uniref:nicotinate-nucleotide--dimethylbenzimidazole phosphoribosyltransferase n=1 Tax=Conexibacter sp. SYSU D00693 TaxID=2812560 RepID=UPI00196AE6D9|nr:nicotinate-nucleotide--dimethylbenzimidazole phosphoribosyltransferase [Conexibacter sp. SYSU D00693]
MRRPVLDPTVDPSRAADRAADPSGWRMDDATRDALASVIAGRRDIRAFRPDPVPDDPLRRLLEAAHRAPSVGLSQPWRFIVVRSEATRARVRAIAQKERERQAPRFDERARAFLDQKVEGVLEAPVGIAVCCVPPPAGTEVLGRGTIPETDLHSTACAIQNLWLTARAEGLGVGWVSFYRPDDLRDVLGIPPQVDPVAWLCVGWPDERPVRPGLERAGWASRAPLDAVVLEERWPAGDDDPAAPLGAGPAADARARTAVRDRADQLVKPVGSLGALEDVVERWAAATGAPPPAPLTAAHLVLAADHGHTDARGTSLFGARVSAQVAEAAARGETAVGVLARARGERAVVADLGLRDGTPDGCADARVAAGTRDATREPAMTAGEARQAMAAGARLASGLLDDTGADCLVVGEIGIGNTATAAALLCALTGTPVERAVGRGTGLDAQGLARKRAAVQAMLDRHGAQDRDPLRALAGVGGLELAGLVGAIHAAHDRRVPVLLDGFATGVAALVAVALRPACREWLVAGHRSAEPAHGDVLAELGLEPLLDLRLRLGEGSGAALALSLVEQAGRLHREMATFEEAGVDGPSHAA